MAFEGPSQPSYFNLQSIAGSNQSSFSTNKVFTCSTGQTQITCPFVTQRGFTGPLVSVPLSRIFKKSRSIDCQNGKIFKGKPFCFPASELKANVTFLGNTHHGKKKRHLKRFFLCTAHFASLSSITVLCCRYVLK